LVSLGRIWVVPAWKWTGGRRSAEPTGALDRIGGGVGEAGAACRVEEEPAKAGANASTGRTASHARFRFLPLSADTVSGPSTPWKPSR
jgi:hypothetical protein